MRKKNLFFLFFILKKVRRANKRLYITPAFSWVLRGVSCEVVASRLVLEMMKVHLHWRDNQAGHGWNKETKRKRLLHCRKQAGILNWKYFKILCVCVFVGACTCVFSDVTLQACVSACPRCGCLHMCLGVFAASLACRCTLLLTGRVWKPPSCSDISAPSMPALLCVIFLLAFGVMANSGPDSPEMQPRWRQSNNTVTSHNARHTGRQTPSDSFHCCLSLPSSLSSDSVTPYTAWALHFRAIQVVPPCHYRREIRQDQKVASLILPRPSAWDIVNDPTSPREFIHSVFSHFLTIRWLVKCCDDISLYLAVYL